MPSLLRGAGRGARAQTFQGVDKINAELFVLTYGALVSQALKEHDSVADVNAYLDQTCGGARARPAVSAHAPRAAATTLACGSCVGAAPAHAAATAEADSVGVAQIDEFLARSGVGRCGEWKETADTIAKVGFKMFLGVTAQVRACDAQAARGGLTAVATVPGERV